MNKIDCFGDLCPLPVLKAEAQLKSIKSGESFMLITDHSCVVRSIEEKYGLKHINIKIDEVMNGVWEITFTKP